MKMIEGGIEMTRAELAALVAYASDDETRPNINVIVVEPSKARAWSTNGHHAVICKAEGEVLPDAPTVAVPREIAEAALRAMGDAPTEYGCDYCADDRQGTYAMLAMVANGRITVGHFAADVPDPPKLVPIDIAFASQGGKPAARGINPRYLATLCLVKDAAQAQMCMHPVLATAEPVRFDCGAWSVSIMPERL